MIDSVEGTQFGRGYVGSYDCPWVSRYGDFVRRWDVLHDSNMLCRVGSSWREGTLTSKSPHATSQPMLLNDIVSLRIFHSMCNMFS